MKKKLASMFVMGMIVCAACAANDQKEQEAIERDYKMLSGTWQLTRAVVNGVSVSEDVVKKTVLITDGNTFRFPQASGIGTHPAGSFTINPAVTPHQVDSVASGGPNAGQVTLGIYEIIDSKHKRACWGPGGGPRPTEFESLPGSKRIL